ncbi:MAG: peptidyl-prolyl cis-trans isomerase [Candidatus Cloacimonadota bacterium]|nr:peptidyl-prolyl cis-trans isomerase [Candidatus Cloacimonadota bacterium]
MKKNIQYLFIFSLLFVFSGLKANPNIMAEVGNKSITWLQLQNHYENLWKEYLADNSKFPSVSEFSPRKDLRKLAMNELIRENLFEIYAEEHNITFSVPEIEAIFRQIYSDKDIFLTNGIFDKQKLIQFKQNYPKRYQAIVSTIKNDYFYTKIENIIKEQFALTDEELYARYIRNNSKIRLAYNIVPDSLMPATFPSTPFYLDKFYEANKNKYSSPRKVKIKFIYIEDRMFLSSTKSYQKYLEKYRKIAHRKSRTKAIELIKKFQNSNIFYDPDFHIFETDFIKRGDNIGQLKNNQNIIKFALIQKVGSVFSMPIEQDDGWIVFQTAEIKRDELINLNDISSKVWHDYINTGKTIYINSEVDNYFEQKIKDEDIYKFNFSYLKLNREELEFDKSLTPDSSAIQKYYEENIEEFTTVRDTLPLEEVISDVIEKLEGIKYKVLADSLIDTLCILVKNNHFHFPKNNFQIRRNIELIQNLPYFTEPYPLIMDTLFVTPEDSIFKKVKDNFLYIGRVNRRKKLSFNEKRKLKSRIKKLTEKHLYEERKKNFEEYYSANKDNFYPEDSYQFVYLFIQRDTTGIRQAVDLQKAQKIFLANKEKYLVENKVKLQTIFLDPKYNISSEIRSINSALRDSIDFSVISKIFYRQNHLSDKNGTFINIEDLDKEIKIAVEKMQMGKISRPIMTAEGYFIIKLLGREQIFEPEFEDVKETIISEMIREKADSLCFESAVSIYDSLEIGYKFAEFDSLGYVDTTSFVKIKEKKSLMLDSNVSIYEEDFEPLYRTDDGNVIPKIFKQENGYAIVMVKNKIQGKKITGYAAYSFAKDRFLDVCKYNSCRIFTDYLSRLVQDRNDSLSNYLGGMKNTGWVSYYDNINNLSNSQIILRDAFSRKVGAYSNPIRFSNTSFGFYHILNKKIESRADFSSIKEQYRKKFIEDQFKEWLNDYKKEKTVIIYRI